MRISNNAGQLVYVGPARALPRSLTAAEEMAVTLEMELAGLDEAYAGEL